MLYIVV